MKKPYFYVKIIGVIIFMMVTKASYSQEVDLRQEVETTNITTENLSTLGFGEPQEPPVDNPGSASVSEYHWNSLYPKSPNSIFKVEQPYNVDLSTGKVNVNVPLAVAGTPDVPVQIGLNYKTGGIKLRDVASWVGLGWNLSCGGKITRIVQSFPDTLNGKFIALSQRAAWTLNDFNDNMKFKDSQPDLYFFEIPGKSGYFVTEGDGVKVNIHTMPYQNVKIEYDIDNESFTIIDDLGNTYFFNDTERTKVEYFFNSNRPNLDYISAWYLTSIYDNKGERIDFTYKTLEPSSSGAVGEYVYDTVVKATTIAKAKNGGEVQIPSTFEYTTRVEPLYITSISWRNGSIEFMSSTGRGDIPDQAYKLDKINIYSGPDEVPVKTFNFEYSAFHDDYLLNPEDGKLKLDKITVSTPKSTGREFYRKFEYFEDYNIPSVIPGAFTNCGYYELDHWGYYNGKNKEKPNGIPKFDIGSAQLTRPRYDDRTPSFAHTRANSLKRIWVTSSGYSEFEYEQNISRKDYPDNDYVQIDTVGGLRIKSIITKSLELSNVTQRVRYEYLEDDGYTSGISFSKPDYYHRAAAHKDLSTNIFIVKDTPVRAMFDLDGTNIRYGKVKEIFDNGSSNTYTFTTYIDHPDEGFMRVISLYPGFSGNREYEWCHKNNVDFAPTNTRFWKRGLLKEKISKDNTGKETYRETYEYNTDAPIMEEIYGVYPFLIGDTNTHVNFVPDYPHLACYIYLSQPIYATKRTVSGIDIPKIVTEYVYDDKDSNPNDLDHLLLKKQIDTCGTDVYVTTYKYPMDYMNTNTNMSGNAIPYMKTNNIVSLPIEIVKYKNDKVVGGEVYIYDNWTYMNNGSITGGLFNLREVKEFVTKEPVLNSDFRVSGYQPGLGGTVFTCDRKYKTKASYEYNYNNKLSCIKERGKPSQSIIYGYNSTLPIAQTVNAESKKIDGSHYIEAFHTSFEDNTGSLNSNAVTGTKVLTGVYHINSSNFIPGQYNIRYWISYNNGVDWELMEHEMDVVENQDRTFTIGGGPLIDELRVYKKGAMMKTRTYNDNGNVTSETDENMITTYYTYDSYGRLSSIRDNTKFALKRYYYNFKKQ